MQAQEVTERLRKIGDPAKAAEMAAYHKAGRLYLGVPNGELDLLVRDWRRALTLEARLDLARDLWDSDIHEARVAAAKLLTQARIRPDAAVWDLICDWVPQFDAWAIADHACSAGGKRIMADLSRLDQVERWTEAEHLWTKRAALVITLSLARLPFPKPEEQAARARVLDWAAGYVSDPRWFIQKAVGWWLRDLSKHDTAATQAFLAAHGARMKPFARREAARHLPKPSEI